MGTLHEIISEVVPGGGPKYLLIEGRGEDKEIVDLILVLHLLNNLPEKEVFAKYAVNKFFFFYSLPIKRTGESFICA